VLIVTDDLGYGDTGCYGARPGSIATPNIDRLAAAGRRFTQAYAPASTCTPTRYALLTGEYAWRQPPKRTNVLAGDAPLAIDPGRRTLPALLREAGYRTALVGKWHLGLGEPGQGIDFNGHLAPGPLEVGFDSAFFIPATVDRVPCVYIENHRVFGLDPADPIRVSYTTPLRGEPIAREHPELVRVPTDNQHSDTLLDGIGRIGYMSGGRAARWKDEDIADVITRRAVDFIAAQSAARPFFLFFGTHDPHAPRVPHPRFRGKSGAGLRGDVIQQIDWCVGELLAALERQGLARNTLVIFTSDNGPVVIDSYRDGSDAALGAHRPAGILRGGKYTVFEGGLRVPLVASWPGRIPAGVSDQVFCLIDLPATLGALVGVPARPTDSPDSLNLLPVLMGGTRAGLRHELVLQGMGHRALRQGNWKFIPPNRPVGTKRPTVEKLADTVVTEPHLYDLAVDPGETRNLASQLPEIAAAMAAKLHLSP
jgi:arylsulfatase A-like enzyme